MRQGGKSDRGDRKRAGERARERTCEKERPGDTMRRRMNVKAIDTVIHELARPPRAGRYHRLISTHAERHTHGEGMHVTSPPTHGPCACTHRCTTAHTDLHKQKDTCMHMHVHSRPAHTHTRLRFSLHLFAHTHTHQGYNNMTCAHVRIPCAHTCTHVDSTLPDAQASSTTIPKGSFRDGTHLRVVLHPRVCVLSFRQQSTARSMLARMRGAVQTPHENCLTFLTCFPLLCGYMDAEHTLAQSTRVNVQQAVVQVRTKTHAGHDNQSAERTQHTANTLLTRSRRS